MNLKEEPLLFELSVPNRSAVSLPDSDVPSYPIPPDLERQELVLPELDELTLVRHFTLLSQKNFSIDTHFYPLGSCTMKYNPKINEQAASLPGWQLAHPLAGDAHTQGCLELIWKLQTALQNIGGFSAGSLQPAAGAQGELAGVLMIRAWQLSQGQKGRDTMLIPDSAHGTNPATCTMAGLKTKTIPSNNQGEIDIAALKENLNNSIAGIMITNPNTLGIFETQIQEICALVHEAGGLVYGDGANLNALAGIVQPAAVGIDVMHFNLHKTFSTPHGGGGPGACFVGTDSKLASYLPGPVVTPIDIKLRNPTYEMRMPDNSIGRLKCFNGNFGILVRAYTYLRMQGASGIVHLAEKAVLNANYLKSLIKDHYPLAYNRVCMHEFVVRGDIAPGIYALDIAKRLIDYGYHPPTIYFPLIVPEAMMIEPTETESAKTIQEFAKAMADIAKEAIAEPALLKDAPCNTPVGRLDEVSAARNPTLCYRG